MKKGFDKNKKMKAINYKGILACNYKKSQSYLKNIYIILNKFFKLV